MVAKARVRVNELGLVKVSSRVAEGGYKTGYSVLQL